MSISRIQILVVILDVDMLHVAIIKKKILGPVSILF